MWLTIFSLLQATSFPVKETGSYLSPMTRPNLPLALSLPTQHLHMYCLLLILPSFFTQGHFLRKYWSSGLRTRTTSAGSKTRSSSSAIEKRFLSSERRRGRRRRRRRRRCRRCCCRRRWRLRSIFRLARTLSQFVQPWHGSIGHKWSLEWLNIGHFFTR